jgi:hypothetical protein|tara:strand:- start:1166 stop:1354 length:189 start_codon:yes stop_codon:yes gene_type:complete
MTNSDFYEELYHRAHDLGVLSILRKRVEKRFSESDKDWDMNLAVTFTQEELNKLIEEKKEVD